MQKIMNELQRLPELTENLEVLQACSVHENWTVGTERAKSSAIYCNTEEMKHVDSVRRPAGREC